MSELYSFKRSLGYLSLDETRKIVQAAVEHQERLKNEPITGRATSLNCGCGGVLHELEPRLPPNIKGPRLSKNRRIRKKQLKRWREEKDLLLAFHFALPLIRLRGYRCADCKRYFSVYGAIAHNIFKVETMPGGAMAIYDRDPEVGKLVT